MSVASLIESNAADGNLDKRNIGLISLDYTRMDSPLHRTRCFEPQHVIVLPASILKPLLCLWTCLQILSTDKIEFSEASFLLPVITIIPLYFIHIFPMLCVLSGYIPSFFTQYTLYTTKTPAPV